MFRFDKKHVSKMKAKLLIVVLTLIVIVACKKDKFNTTPQLTFKEVNTQVLSPNQVIIFRLEYTDKEGDIQDTIYVEKLTRNCPASNFNQRYALPKDIPTQKNTKGEMEIRFAYGVNLGYPAIKEPACGTATTPINDSCVFRFALKDKANNVSDTISSPEIVLIKR